MEEKTTFPVLGYVQTEEYGRLPVLDIPMMDDSREKELGAQSAGRWNAFQAASRPAAI